MKSDSPQYNRALLAGLERIEGEGEEVDEAFAKRAERELRLAGKVPAEAVRANFPAVAAPLAPADPARRERLERHLAETLENAALGGAGIPRDPAAAEAPEDGREALSRSACAACRGSCCRAGGDHAYLTEETLARVLDAHPAWTRAELLEAYRSRLPAESVVDSCVYHGPAGCGLPRSLRSVTCNTYLCVPLTRLRESLPAHDPPPVLAVMFEHGRWTRSALLETTGPKILQEAP